MEVKMKKSLSEKMTMMQRQKSGNKKRLLISINVFGSAGPIRFVVNEDDKVVGVVDMALKQYARQGRLPLLGSDPHHFFLYPVTSGFEALSASSSIGNCGERNFMLCKKNRQPLMTEGRPQVVTGLKGTRSWKSWLTKSFFHKMILTE
ncbi:PREDICTED: uncharacterized protein At4g22758-like [Ipomoea nil]|uniref:uncharacterized protein At4g22758-like n=1 Tax=Ipomoea nil TaxID=35883 RepID=UPI000900DFC7|nr:PREDICTED: uncharacterized protein At4g22758-like [Ipomoea nil]